MLSQRDRELARAIGYEVRHGPVVGPGWGPLSGPISWLGAALTGGLSYWLRDAHSLIWGVPLFIAAGFLSSHSAERQEIRGSRVADALFLVLYSSVFGIALLQLWSREYIILTGMIGLAAFATISAQLTALLQSRPM